MRSIVAIVLTVSLATLVHATDFGFGYSRDRKHILFKGQRIEKAGRHDIKKFAKASVIR